MSQVKQMSQVKLASRLGLSALLGMAFTIGLPSAAHAQTVTPPPVPAEIELPVPAEAFLLGRGVGTQNYVCQPVDLLGRVAWTLFTPQATLFNDLGDQLTSHFFSPIKSGAVRATWVDSRDTSTVRAQAIASVPDPTGSGAVPWVLLQVVESQPGPTGGQTLIPTTFIHRLNTVGGSAPATGCDIPTDIGSKTFVRYTADYFFYRAPSNNE